MQKTIQPLVWVALLFLNFTAYGQGSDSLINNFKKVNSPPLHSPVNRYIIPALFITYGAIALGRGELNELDISTRNEIKEDHPNFIAHLDDYLKYVPLTTVYSLDLIGVKGKHNVIDQTALMMLSQGLNITVVTKLKAWTKRLRPDGTSYNSFPSGHTSTAFAAAEFLNQEFKGVSRWYGYGGYLVATATGILRIYNDRHWVSDVVAGAGFGILSTKFTYWGLSLS